MLFLVVDDFRTVTQFNGEAILGLNRSIWPVCYARYSEENEIFAGIIWVVFNRNDSFDLSILTER